MVGNMIQGGGRNEGEGRVRVGRGKMDGRKKMEGEKE